MSSPSCRHCATEPATADANASIGARPSRRAVLVAAPALLVALALPRPASATPQSMAAAMREALGDAPINDGRVHIDINSLVDNGNSAPLAVRVDSPMTAQDRVTAIYVFSEQNPSSNVVRFFLGPRAGRPEVRTRIRLAATQRLVAVARMSDGSLWSGAADVIVTQAACIDGT